MTTTGTTGSTVTGTGTSEPTTTGATAAPGASSSPAAAATTGAAVTPNVTEEALRAAEAKGRNSAFAEARRLGIFKKSALAAMDGADGTGGPGARAPAGGEASSAASPSALRSLDRAVTTIGATLTDDQWRRAERDFLSEKPADAVAWLRAYFPAPAAASATTPAVPAAAQNARPASGAGGAPARGTVPLDQQNVLEMSPEDVTALVGRIGPTAFKALYAKALKGIRVSLS